jgi:hypothetical protein
VLVVAQIPDALSHYGINYRSDFILGAPYGIEIDYQFTSSIALMKQF